MPEICKTTCLKMDPICRSPPCLPDVPDSEQCKADVIKVNDETSGECPN